MANSIKVLLTVLAVMSSGACLAATCPDLNQRFSDKVSVTYYVQGEFSDVSLNNNLEYKLTNRIDFVNSLTYKFLTSHHRSTVYDNTSNEGAFVTTDSDSTAHGLGDVDVGFREKLTEGGFGALSHTLKLKIPGPYDKSDPLPLGNGQYDLTYRLKYDYLLPGILPTDLNLEAGYRRRFGGLSDQFLYGVGFGLELTGSLHATARLNGSISLRNGSSSGSESLNPTIERQLARISAQCGGDGSYTMPGTSTSEETRRQRVNFGLDYKYNEAVGMQFSYSPRVRSGDTDEHSSYSLGIYRQFN